MRIVKQTTSNKFLNIKEVYDPDNHCNGYQFAERRGINSIAFICYDRNTNKYLLNNEYTPPTNEFLVRAFGGSLDKDESIINIVIEEVKEEAGYDVDKEMVHVRGNVFVSTQMNQRCFLFLVDITDAIHSGRTPENKVEAMAKTVWKTKEEIIDGDDWKSIVIVTKVY